MKQIFTEDKLELAKKMIVYDFKRNKFSSIFELLKDDIKRLVDLGLPYKMILMNINDELNSDIKYNTFLKWTQKNIKQKNQNSNNLKINTKKEELKKEALKKDINNPKKENKKNDKLEKPWWEKEIERASEGMKEAALRL